MGKNLILFIVVIWYFFILFFIAIIIIIIIYAISLICNVIIFFKFKYRLIIFFINFILSIVSIWNYFCPVPANRGSFCQQSWIYLETKPNVVSSFTSEE